MAINSQDIVNASQRIAPYIFKTPLLHSLPLSRQLGVDVFLKLENEQVTGSFKARGSLNKVLSIPNSDPRIVVTASTGNHGQGVAYALSKADRKGIIFLPKSASPSKIKALSLFDVQLEFIDGDPLTTELAGKSYANKNNAIWISPYNDDEVIAGQGTIALEIQNAGIDPSAIFITVGGGGLISGIAAFFKTKESKTTIIGCQPENSPDMLESIKAGKIVKAVNLPTLSDGSAGHLEPGSITFEYCRKWVDDYIIVNEKRIADGIRWMAGHHHKMIEGSAAVALMGAVDYSHSFKAKGPVVVVICGANIDPVLYGSILNG